MILLIEDNPRLSKNIQEYLEFEHFSVEAIRDGRTGLEKARTGIFDLILLDLNLPLLDGMEICDTLRKENILTPILMLTARGSVEEKVDGLNIGANDYLVKPFEFPELIARIHALLRRQTSQKSEIFSLGEITVHFASHEVRKGGIAIPLSPKEFAILSFLIRHRGIIKSRTEILDAVWGDAEEATLFDSDTVEVHISYLRKKLGKDTIETVRGVGYTIRR